MGVLDESAQQPPIQYPMYGSLVSVTTGFVSAGLRYQHRLAPCLRILGSVSALVGFGGSIAGMPPATSAGSGMGHQIGVALVYQPSARARVTVGYSRKALPIRGYTLTERGVSLRASYLFF